MSAFTESPRFTHIDPFEIQCWPPNEVDAKLTELGVEYPDLLDSLAGLLVSRSPRFAQDLCPYLESYMHEHNFPETGLAPDAEGRLRAMIADPDTVDVRAFAQLAPMVLAKATTLATETFVQTRPAWVLKALPHLDGLRATATPQSEAMLWGSV